MNREEFIALAADARGRAERLGYGDVAKELDHMLAVVEGDGPRPDDISQCQLMLLRDMVKGRASTRDEYMLLGTLSEIHRHYTEWPARWTVGDLCCAMNERGWRYLARVHAVKDDYLELEFADGTLRRAPRGRVVQPPGKGEQVVSFESGGPEFAFISSRDDDHFVVNHARLGSLRWRWNTLDLHHGIAPHEGEFDLVDGRPVAQPQAAPPPRPPSPPPQAGPLPPPPTNQTAYATPALSDQDALPFQPGQAQPPPPAAADQSPHEDAGETAFMPPLDIDEDVLPFDADAPELSVEQYASLCVERTLSPGEESEVAKRYQVLTEQALRALDERFRQRFATEGELLHRYQQAYARYEAWLRNQKTK